MITIKIGTAERRDGDIDARWITNQVNARIREGKKFCVFIKVNCGDVNLNLPSRDCPKAGGGGGMKQFHPKENFIIDEWRKKGFSDQDVKPGMVVSFWEFVKQVCG